MKQVLLLNIHNSKNNKSIYSCQHLLNILYLDNYKSDTYKDELVTDRVIPYSSHKLWMPFQ